MNLTDYIKKIFAMEQHTLENDRTQLIDKMRKRYQFLETDFGYVYTLDKETDKYPGGPKYYLNKYTSLKAQRQIEIILHRNSTLIYFYLKRLQNNLEPAYADNDNCYTFYEIDVYNGIDDLHRHHPYSPPDYALANIKTGLEILKSIPGILAGTEWFDRNKLDKIFLETKGYKSGQFDNPVFVLLKKTFSFLETEHHFKIIYDYDKLRPFEQGPGGHLVYSNGQITVGFSVDFREQNFSVYLPDPKTYDLENFWQMGKQITSGITTEKDFGSIMISSCD